MPDKPIIMSDESVRAIMAGLKTQTRRVVRGWPNAGTSEWQLLGCHEGVAAFRSSGERLEVHAPCQPGDTLWVRETWRPWSWREDEPIRIQYKSDGAIGICDVDDEGWYERIAVEATNACERAGLPYDGEGYHWPDGKCPLPWRSLLFLPRGGSRLSLLVTNVRAQRVQDISEEDARAEGVQPCEGGIYHPCKVQDAARPYACGYAERWDSINAKRGHPFAANDWVFAYTFEVKK